MLSLSDCNADVHMADVESVIIMLMRSLSDYNDDVVLVITIQIWVFVITMLMWSLAMRSFSDYKADVVSVTTRQM